MSPMSVSTLEILEQSEMPPAYARSIAKAIEADFPMHLNNVATKADLAELKGDLRTDMHQINGALKDDLHKSIATLSFRMYLAILGQLAVTLSVMYYLLQTIRQ